MAFTIIICLMDLAWGGEKYKWAINVNEFGLRNALFCDDIYLKEFNGFSLGREQISKWLAKLSL
jgi:hypothetical protein